MPTDTNLDRAIYDLLMAQCPAMWLGWPIGPGNVYWVDNANGVVGNSGIRPDLAVPSITEALTLCVPNNNNDYIMVIAAWQEAATITVNRTRVHIIGLNNYLRQNSNHMFVGLNATGAWPIFTVSSNSNESEIAGFAIGGGPANAGIENVAGTPMGLHIHDCSFGHVFAQDTPQDGILIGLNATNIRIEHCVFLGAPGGKGTLTRDGIRFQGGGDPLNGNIENNQFKGLPGVAIDFVSVGNDTGGITIKDNVIVCEDVDGGPAAVGNGITLGVTCRGFLVVGNKAGHGQAQTANNPYLDNAIAAPLNTWIANYNGNALIYPA